MLYPGILVGLRAWAERLAVPFPQTLKTIPKPAVRTQGGSP